MGKKTRDPNSAKITDPDTKKYEFASTYGFRFCGLMVINIRFKKFYAVYGAESFIDL